MKFTAMFWIFAGLFDTTSLHFEHRLLCGLVTVVFIVCHSMRSLPSLQDEVPFRTVCKIGFACFVAVRRDRSVKASFARCIHYAMYPPFPAKVH